MPKIILHIGQPKTGTTSIQGCLASNRETLLKRDGVLYSKSLGRRLHPALLVIAHPPLRKNARPKKWKPRDAAFRILSLNDADTPEGLEAFRERIDKGFARELKKESPRAVVLSCEMLWGSLSVYDMRRLRDFLLRHGDEVEVVIYLRRQEERVAALYSEGIKMGRAESLGEEKGRHRTFRDLEKLDEWAATFGQDSITIRLFDRALMKNGDAVDDFLQVIGVSAEGLERDERTNPSLDMAKLEFIRRVAPETPGRRDYKDPDIKRRYDLIKALENLPPMGPKLTLPADWARDIRAAHAEMNAEIARRYLGRDDGVLFEDKPLDESALAPDEVKALDVDAAMELARVAWQVSAAAGEAPAKPLWRGLMGGKGEGKGRRGGGKGAGRKGPGGAAKAARGAGGAGPGGRRRKDLGQST